MTADPNYHSEENLKKCEAEKIDAYIPDVNFRKRDPRLAGQEKYKAAPVKKFSLADFTYNAEHDGYINIEKIVNFGEMGKLVPQLA